MPLPDQTKEEQSDVASAGGVNGVKCAAQEGVEEGDEEEEEEVK